jgi:hypothetical protein
MKSALVSILVSTLALAGCVVTVHDKPANSSPAPAAPQKKQAAKPAPAPAAAPAPAQTAAKPAPSAQPSGHRPPSLHSGRKTETSDTTGAGGAAATGDTAQPETKAPATLNR